MVVNLHFSPEIRQTCNYVHNGLRKDKAYVQPCYQFALIYSTKTDTQSTIIVIQAFLMNSLDEGHIELNS